MNQVNIDEEEQVENNGMDLERIKLPREELKKISVYCRNHTGVLVKTHPYIHLFGETCIVYIS